MNISPSWSSKISINTDSNRIYARATDRKNINYLHVVCYIRVALLTRLMWGTGAGPPDGTYYAVTDSCHCCHSAYQEHAMQFPTDRLKQTTTPLLRNLTVVRREMHRIVDAVRKFGETHDTVESDVDVGDDHVKFRAARIKVHQFSSAQTRHYAEVRDLFMTANAPLSHAEVTELAPLSLSTAPNLSQRDLRKLPIAAVIPEMALLAGDLYAKAADPHTPIQEWYRVYAAGLSPTLLPWYPLVCYIHESGFVASFLAQLSEAVSAPLPPTGCSDPISTVRSITTLCPAILQSPVSTTPVMHVDMGCSLVGFRTRLREWLVGRWT